MAKHEGLRALGKGRASRLSGRSQEGQARPLRQEVKVSLGGAGRGLCMEAELTALRDVVYTAVHNHGEK